MNPLLPRILIGLGAILLAATIGWHTGAKVEREKWEAEKIQLQADQQKALQDQVAKNEATLKDQQEKSFRASQNYEKAIDDLRTKYSTAGGLRITHAVCDQSAGSTKTDGTDRSDETGTGTIELPGRTQESLFAMTKRADELAEQLRALQQWIIANGFYPATIPE